VGREKRTEDRGLRTEHRAEGLGQGAGRERLRSKEAGSEEKASRVVRRSEGGEIGGSDRQLESFIASKMVVGIIIDLHYILYYGGQK